MIKTELLGAFVTESRKPKLERENYYSAGYLKYKIDLSSLHYISQYTHSSTFELTSLSKILDEYSEENVIIKQKERLLGQELCIVHHNSVHTIVVKIKSAYMRAEIITVGEKEIKRTQKDIGQTLN